MYGSLGGCSLGAWSDAIVRDRGTMPTITKPSSASPTTTPSPSSGSRLPLILAAAGIAGIIYYVKFRKK